MTDYCSSANTCKEVVMQCSKAIGIPLPPPPGGGGGGGGGGSRKECGDRKDNDGDGLSAFLEFALGGSDNDPADAETAIRVGIGTYHDGVSTDDYLTIILRKNLLAQNIVDFQFDVSQNLITWRGGDAVVFVSETDNGDGTATLTWRSATPVDLSAEEFIRFRVSQNE